MTRLFGGRPVVYTEHNVLERQFAIKVLRRDMISDQTAAERFRREARAALVDACREQEVLLCSDECCAARDEGEPAPGTAHGPYVAARPGLSPGAEGQRDGVAPGPVGTGVVDLVLSVYGAVEAMTVPGPDGVPLGRGAAGGPQRHSGLLQDRSR